MKATPGGLRTAPCFQVGANLLLTLALKVLCSGRTGRLHAGGAPPRCSLERFSRSHGQHCVRHFAGCCAPLSAQFTSPANLTPEVLGLLFPRSQTPKRPLQAHSKSHTRISSETSLDTASSHIAAPPPKAIFKKAAVAKRTAREGCQDSVFPLDGFGLFRINRPIQAPLAHVKGVSRGSRTVRLTFAIDGVAFLTKFCHKQIPLSSIGTSHVANSQILRALRIPVAPRLQMQLSGGEHFVRGHMFRTLSHDHPRTVLHLRPGASREMMLPLFACS